MPNNKRSTEFFFLFHGRRLTRTIRKKTWSCWIPNSDPKLTEPDDWRTVTCPAEIKLMLKLWNQRHFGQAEYEGTPFTQEPLQTLFNWSASTHQAELVQVNYSSPEINSVCCSLLDPLTRFTPLEDLQADVTLKQMRGKFKTWRKTTSTSPSGRHLGHHKTLFTTIDRSIPEPKREAFKVLQKGIAIPYQHMINYVIRHNYAFDQWKNIVNIIKLLSRSCKVQKRKTIPDPAIAYLCQLSHSQGRTEFPKERIPKERTPRPRLSMTSPGSYRTYFANRNNLVREITHSPHYIE